MIMGVQELEDIISIYI